MWAALTVIGTLSIGIHIVLATLFAFQNAASLGRGSDWSDSFKLLAVVAFDGVVLYEFVSNYRRTHDVMMATLAVAPQIFEFFNELLAEAMAEFMYIGFVPGGKTGIVIGTAISVVINVFEVFLLREWLRDRRKAKSPK